MTNEALHWVGDGGGGPVARIALLTHTNALLPEHLKQAQELWAELKAKAERCDQTQVPREIMSVMSGQHPDMLRALTVMRELARANRGKELWATLKFFGLTDG